MMYKNTVVDWPLDKNTIRRGVVNNTFGMVRKDGAGLPRPHQGWDFSAILNTPCFAIADGKVADVYQSADYGTVLVLTIGSTGMFAAYAHLNSVTVSKGQLVTLGQQVGLTGETGNAKGMALADQHLHFEIRNVPRAGLGLAGRVSPFEVFGICPLKNVELRDLPNE